MPHLQNLSLTVAEVENDLNATSHNGFVPRSFNIVNITSEISEKMRNLIGFVCKFCCAYKIAILQYRIIAFG